MLGYMRHTDPLSDDARVGTAGLWLVGASFATVTGLVIALSLTGDVPDASVAGPSDKVEQSQPAQPDSGDPNATSTETPDTGTDAEADAEATPGADATNDKASDDATPGDSATPTATPTTQGPTPTTPAPTTTQPVLEKPNPQPRPVTQTPTPDRPHAATPTPKPTKPAPVTTMTPTKPAPQPVKPKPTKKTYSLQATSGELLLEKQAMTWLNEYRLANRLPVIAVNRCAVNEASAWSHQMRKENKIYHNPKPSCGTRRGENVAGGSFGSVAELMNAWKKSPGHNANMLSNNFTGAYVGIRIGETPDGKRRWYATTTFVG